MSKPTIYFDMDGTLLNLYSVPDWLPKLRNYDPSPYADARPMLNMRVLARYLNRLKEKGYKVGIISWLSKDTTPLYDEAVRRRKITSLRRHLGSVEWDEIHLIHYGYPKHYAARDKAGILFDDNAEVREDWSGTAYPETDILAILKELLK